MFLSAIPANCVFHNVFQENRNYQEIWGTIRGILAIFRPVSTPTPFFMKKKTEQWKGYCEEIEFFAKSGKVNTFDLPSINRVLLFCLSLHMFKNMDYADINT